MSCNSIDVIHRTKDDFWGFLKQQANLTDGNIDWIQILRRSHDFVESIISIPGFREEFSRRARYISNEFKSDGHNSLQLVDLLGNAQQSLFGEFHLVNGFTQIEDEYDRRIKNAESLDIYTPALFLFVEEVSQVYRQINYLVDNIRGVPGTEETWERIELCRRNWDYSLRQARILHVDGCVFLHDCYACQCDKSNEQAGSTVLHAKLVGRQLDSKTGRSCFDCEMIGNAADSIMEWIANKEAPQSDNVTWVRINRSELPKLLDHTGTNAISQAVSRGTIRLRNPDARGIVELNSEDYRRLSTSHTSP